MITKAQISTYCLLAHVNDNDHGINDLAKIFIPLVKKTLSTLRASGVMAGNTKDIKQEFDKLFSLDAPFGLIQRLMRQLESESKQKNSQAGIVVYEDGSFVVSEYEFTELDEIINHQESDIELVEDSYMTFIDVSGLKRDEEPSIFEFLDSHHQEMSGFFATRSEFEPAPEYTIPALFIDSVKNDEKLFGILRRIYLGSIISSYLQLPDVISNGNIKELVLDTSFIVSLLDISSEEACHTCRMVLKIAKGFGCKITVLNITIDETKALLERCSGSIGSLSLTQFLAPTSIEAGCARKQLSRSDLLRIANSLKHILENDYGVTFYNISERMIKKAQTSEVYKKITSRQRNPDGAHHDGIAVYYVANKRGTTSRSLLETNCWFVSSHDPHRGTSLRTNGDGNFFETIRAEYLLNVMWLSNPSARLKEVPGVGLSKLVASTIERSLPSHVVLREFSNNLKKLGPDELTANDVALVANSAAVKSARQLEDLNRLAETSTEKFCADILSIADAERERLRELQAVASSEKLIRAQIEKKHKGLESQLAKANLELYQVKSLEIDRVIKQISNKKGSDLLATSRLKIIIQVLGLLGVLFLFLIGYVLLIIIKNFGWAEVEPVFAVLGFILPSIIFVFYYMVWGKDFKEMLLQLNVTLHAWMMRRNGASELSIEELQEKLSTLQADLSQFSLGQEI